MVEILVVDDEEDIRNLAKMVLEGKGFKVLTASNSGNALIMAEEEHPDLILLDIVMPGRNGFDTCKLLKFKPTTHDIPVIMFSALGRQRDKEMAEEAGADDYITKPFDETSLVRIIEKHLNSNN
jgi:DNA-binding response OmpR family regulator